MTSTTPAQERTQQTASTAADEGKHVAGVAKDEAAGVASEAMSQARSVLGDTVRNASDQAAEQTRTQRDRLTGTLRSLGDDLDKMGAQADSGLAGDLAREAAQRAHALSQHLDGREPGELLEDVRSFARRRPGTFLIGALGAGVVAGRLLRGTKDGVAGAAAVQGGTPSAGPALSPQRPVVPERPTYEQSAPVTRGIDQAPQADVVGHDRGTTLEDDLLGGVGGVGGPGTTR